MAPNVSCIIPAYNEGPRIAQVLDIVRVQPLVDEVIVVDDGSQDDTVARVMPDTRYHADPATGQRWQIPRGGRRVARSARSDHRVSGC